MMDKYGKTISTWFKFEIKAFPAVLIAKRFIKAFVALLWIKKTTVLYIRYRMKSTFHNR